MLNRRGSVSVAAGDCGSMAQDAAQLTVVSAEADVPPRDHALAGLTLLAQFHGVPVDPAQLAHQFGGTGEPFDETALLLAAKQLGLKAKITAQPAERMAMATLPALALWPDGDRESTRPNSSH